MDILQFINSKDVRNYLKKINYNFTAPEAAWLIYRSKNHTVYEKLGAYEQFMKEYQDCKVEVANIPTLDSLFEYLKEYIENCKKAIDEFSQPGGIYSIKVCFRDRDTNYEVKYLFDNFTAVKEQCKSEMQWNYIEDAVSFVISKHFPKNKAVKNIKYPVQIVLRANDLEIIDIDILNMFDIFRELAFDFPVPFKAGDIVFNKYSYQEPVVFCSVGHFPQSKSSRINGNVLDMTYNCIAVIDDSLQKDFDFNYMDLEYYTEDLADEYKLLLPVSLFIKDEIDIALCCDAFHSLALKDYIEKSMPRGYTNEIMKELGMKNE